MSCSTTTTTTTTNTNTNISSDSSTSAVSSAQASDQIMNPSTSTADSSNPQTEEPKFKKIKLTSLSSYEYDSDENLKLSNSKNLKSFSNSPSNFYTVKKLEERIGGILCCTVCLDLPQTAIYQCNNGHLMCAGCFSHLLADARLKDEQATCPNCRCEISKTSCSRNLAVEKTLSELPANCMYCNCLYPRNLLDNHQKEECLERPTRCIYNQIGCNWEGPYHELDFHKENCAHPNKPGREIIEYLNEKDAQNEEEYQSLNHLVNFLSFEKICFNDLQFKQYKTDEITPKLYFETNRFNAFFHQWVLKARVNDNQKNPNLSLNRYISFQLILKSKLNNTQPNFQISFCVLKGPFGEVPINARVQTFEFNQNKTETDYIKLNIKSTDCNKLLASKTINFRFFMFQS